MEEVRVNILEADFAVKLYSGKFCYSNEYGKASLNGSKRVFLFQISLLAGLRAGSWEVDCKALVLKVFGHLIVRNWFCLGLMSLEHQFDFYGYDYLLKSCFHHFLIVFYETLEAWLDKYFAQLNYLFSFHRIFLSHLFGISLLWVQRVITRFNFSKYLSL